ncbi:MAG TPA: type IV pilin protein [Limnobacter sp.]|uniref:type IV pilin protein n=1 Tax=Limnobacter sp. TaxID=2003368 RepID=UPI002E35B6E7|nr:type IV pilin protein [Limnobacter sp.]HEX5484821.1 type IV pilin protein [Limnobacter sp.]
MRDSSDSRHGCKVSGFTLIEMVITMAILAIIATLAFPAYSDYVMRSRRSEAQGLMMELAQYMEQQHLSNGRYTNSNNTAPNLPFTQSPKTGVARYTIKLTDITANSYTLTASSSDDPCSPMSIDQSGNQTSKIAGCWLH